MRIHARNMASILSVFLYSQIVAFATDPTPQGYQILRQMGADGQFVIPDQSATKRYLEMFRKRDVDEDWELSADEAFRAPAESITESGFTLADVDSSRHLSHDEFNRHQIIRDEAITILQRMDSNRDSQVTSQEFIAGSRIEDEESAATAFSKLDTNKDGSLTSAEVLPVWDKWARQETPPVTARLIIKQKTYELQAELQSNEFRRRIQNETDVEKLPPSPRVRLVLELKNIGRRPLAVWPGGGIENPQVIVEGDGLIRPENLQGGGGSSGSTTPQPVIQPGKTFRVRIRSLNPEEIGFDNVYWTKAGQYRISASYPVYENLPPHLPQLFPNQPMPIGKPKKYVVTSPPVTVMVVASETTEKQD
jgi:Ca2+-binding EF-hand superfamily protein